MAQHPRPIGPTGTNTAATFSVEMTTGWRPYRPQLGKPQPLGWLTSQTTHVSAPFSVEMVVGARPEQPRPAFKAPIGWSVSQITHTAAPVSLEMFAGWHPDRALPRKLQPLDTVANMLTFNVFSVEMAIGWHPDTPQLRKPFAQGWSVSQITHVAAPFSVDMVSDTRPQWNRAWLAPRSISAFVPPDVLVFSVEMAQGYRPDRPQLAKPRPNGWSVSQLTHTSAPVSIEMLAGGHPDRNRVTHGIQPQSAAVGPVETTTGPVLVQPRGSRYQWKFHDATIYK